MTDPVFTGAPRPGFISGIYNAATKSLNGKIILLTCSAALMSAVFVSGIAYFRFGQITYDTAIEKLAGETRLMAQRFKISYDQMKSDVQVISQTPPTSGILRSTANNNIDPLDGSSTFLWRQRLSTIFSSVMKTRPHYQQMRFIGVADGGREIVRVNRTSIGYQTVAESRLQQKAAEPYFQAALNLGRQEVYYSAVTHNRENGAIDSALIPTVRVVVPVFDSSDEVFGMVVINANYAEMLSHDFAEIAPTNTTYVVNGSGDYMRHTVDGLADPLELAGQYTVPPPDFVSYIVNTPFDEVSFTNDENLLYAVRLQIEPNNPNAFLGVVLQLPQSELRAGAVETRTISLVTGGIVVLLCLVLSLFLARKLTAPLLRMTSLIRHSSGHENLKGLPVDRDDEIGELARAFAERSRELSDSELRASAVIDNVLDGLITIDEAGTVHSYNPSCARIYGYSVDEVVGRNVAMLMPEKYSSAHAGYLHNYMVTGKKSIIGTTRELQGQRKDGTCFPMELSIAELHLDGRRMFSGVVRDITERKQIETMTNAFISTVNHEIRTPLTSIQGSLGLLMFKAKENVDEKSRRLLELSYDNCQRLARLVDDILDIEKIAAGKMEFNFEVSELCSLVKETVDRQVSYAEKYNVVFKTSFEVAEINVNLDKDRFNQALVNLLSNAAKFSDPGSNIDIAVSMASAGAVQISVRDYGDGIPEDFHEEIFGKFAQADGTATRARGGSGLGLNITKSIVEAFDGSIDFETEEGVGTTFTMVLPVSSAIKKSA